MHVFCVALLGEPHTQHHPAHLPSQPARQRHRCVCELHHRPADLGGRRQLPVRVQELGLGGVGGGGDGSVGGGLEWVGALEGPGLGGLWGAWGGRKTVHWWGPVGAAAWHVRQAGRQEGGPGRQEGGPGRQAATWRWAGGWQRSTRTAWHLGQGSMWAVCGQYVDSTWALCTSRHPGWWRQAVGLDCKTIWVGA